MALFNFAGIDVDSGTAVEFIYAKALDIPSVILRTDFRSAGDVLKKGDRWNLLLSGYPRTKIIYRHSMVAYQEALRIASRGGEPTLTTLLDQLYAPMANEIIHAFGSLLRSEHEKPRREELKQRLRWGKH